MLTYKEILNDKLIQNIYDKVDKHEEHPWSTHGLGHINNVIGYAKEIYEVFNLPKDSLDDCLIACALHDVGAILGKQKHNERGFDFTLNYLLFSGLTEKQIKSISLSILHHGNSSSSSSLMEKVLVLADKLDITKSRILPYGFNIKGMRQMGNINAVKLSKTNEKFIVDILTNNNFNLKEWEEYYFTKKVYNAITVLAEHVNLEPEIKYINLKNENIYSTNSLLNAEAAK